MKLIELTKILIITFLILIPNIKSKKLKRTTESEEESSKSTSKTSTLAKTESQTKTKTKAKNGYGTEENTEFKTETKSESGFYGTKLLIREVGDVDFTKQIFNYQSFASDTKSNFNDGINYGNFYIDLKKVEEGGENPRGIAIEFKNEPLDNLITQIGVKSSKYSYIFPYRSIVHVSKHPQYKRNILLEYNTDFHKKKYYVVNMEMAKDMKEETRSFIIDGLNKKITNLKKFLLQKKKLLLDEISNAIKAEKEEDKNKSMEKIEDIKRSTLPYFIPRDSVFNDIKMFVDGKKFKEIHEILNGLSPPGFDSLAVEYIPK